MATTTTRLRDVARAAGVDTSTASVILSDSPKASRYALATRQRILDAARQLNYQPNAAAKALATRRTGSIGMTLAKHVARGWANHYFAGQLVGVEEVCRERGYALHINLYDLNDLDSFVFPKHVQQRAVDGVILAGYVRSGIIKRFHDFGIPVVCIGENHEVPESVPMVRVDHVAKSLEAIRHAFTRGHRRIGHCVLPMSQKTDVAARVAAAARADASLNGLSIRQFRDPGTLDLAGAARAVLDEVLSLPAADRPTVLLFMTLPMSVAVLKEMRSRGLRCPEDLSIIADNDDDLCELCDPPLTAMGQDLPLLGRIAATAMIDLLESSGKDVTTTLVPARPLAVRASVARLPTS